MQRRLVIEGWRGIHHSYALVAQAHALCLLGRPTIALRFRDLPYFSDRWQRSSGVFDVADERRLAGIASPEPAFAPEATWNLRPERPDFTPPANGRKFVFGTPEHRVLPLEAGGPYRSAAAVSPQIDIVTPSHWTALAYRRFGFEDDRIHVVPHGIDPAVMHPDETNRAAARTALGVQDDFVFVSIGAMTGNKGIGFLLAAFAAVAQELPRVRLLLKGADALYPSQDLLRSALNALPAAARERVASRLLYQGSTFSMRQMATFMRAGDCYVAPYFAEGFNLPVLEAAACGLAVICTAGGPTDDFTDPSFASRISSRVVPARVGATQTGDALLPDHADLVERMRDAARDAGRTRGRGAIGASWVAERYTWDKVTDVLLGAIFPVAG